MSHAPAQSITLLTEGELRDLVPLDLNAVDVVERAFARLAKGDVIMPPVLSMHIEAANGEVDIKTAYVPGFETFAVKVSPGFFDNPSIGLPSLNGLMVAFCARTGVVKAVLLDNGYLTNVRTAAAGAVAVRHLAAPDARVLGIVGTGQQARLQAQAAALVRPIDTVLVWGRDHAKAEQCARDLEAAGLSTRPIDTAQELVSQSDVVVTTTPASTPVIMAEWLHPGLHITAMGSDQETKNEIDPTALARANLYVADTADQCAVLGELRSARAAELFTGKDVVELGSVVSGLNPGRRAPFDVTIADLTGTGAQDTAIATLAIERAMEESTGRVIQA